VSISLYRKYRPETFTDVVGQEHIETTLKKAVLTGNVSHAYLFCGPRGTGKTTTARLLAKALLCDSAPTDQPDGTCPHCLQIAEGLHPDVYELDAASRTGVENVREEIISRVQYAPTQGSHKFYIIDEVHMLSTGAFNALLKTLEEPPDHVVFVLCTTDSHKVPETIQSRCLRFDFHRLSSDEIITRLRYICEHEGFTAEPEALALIAQRAQGGMRNAITELEQIAIFGGGAVSFEAAESMLGEVQVGQLFGVTSLIAARDVANCFAWVASFTQSGTDISQFVRELTTHVRNLYVAAVVGDRPDLTKLLEGEVDDAQRYREQVAEFDSIDRLAFVLVVLGDLASQLRTAANARLALEVALTRMARPESDLTLESLAARIAQLETVVSSSAKPPIEPPSQLAQPTAPLAKPPASPVEPEPASVAPLPKPAESPQPLSSVTTEAAERTLDPHRILQQLDHELTELKKRSIQSMLGGARAHSDPKTAGLLIELPDDATFAKANLERPETKEILLKLIEQISGAPLALTFTLGAPSLVSQAREPGQRLDLDSSQSSGGVHDSSSSQSPGTRATEQSEAGAPDAANPAQTSLANMLASSFGTEVPIETIPPKND
jgi:DNA polymerase-3 subunit gamma/tau